MSGLRGPHFGPQGHLATKNEEGPPCNSAGRWRVGGGRYWTRTSDLAGVMHLGRLSVCVHQHPTAYAMRCSGVGYTSNHGPYPSTLVQGWVHAVAHGLAHRESEARDSGLALTIPNGVVVLPTTTHT